MSNNTLQFIIGAALILCLIFAPSLAAAITYAMCAFVIGIWLFLIGSSIHRYIIKLLRRKYKANRT